MSINGAFKKSINTLVFLNLLILLVLPQLNNVHYDPLPQFWAEATVAYAIIGLFVITCLCFKSIAIPKITIAVSLFALFLSLQQFVTHIDFVGLSYITAIELFLCILLAISTSSIIQEYGLSEFVSMLSVALIVGAVLQSLIGLIQYTGTSHNFHGMIFYDSAHPTTDIFGHFGQRNHYCHYLSWAIFGLIYLHQKEKLKSVYFAPLLLWLIYSITIAASRSVFIYFFLACVISALYYVKTLIQQSTSHKSSKQLFLTILIASSLLVACEYIVPLLQHALTHHSAISSGLQRIASGDDGSVTGRRFVEWQKAWMAFKLNPIFGYGLNEYAKQSIALQPLFPHAPLNDGLFTNCHNLILQLLAETGIIGTLIVCIGTVYAIYRIAKLNSIEGIIILCMLFTTIAHSMVEYPLWYFYFLAPFVMFLSIDSPLTTVKPGFITAIAIVPVAAIVYLLVSGSILFNVLVDYNDPPSEKADFVSQAQYLNTLSTHNTLWEYPVFYTLDNYIEVDSANTNAAFDLNTQFNIENKFSNFHPYPDNLIKQAKLNFNLGNKTEAKNLVHLALVSYPVYQDSFMQSLRSKQHKYTALYRIAHNYRY